MKPPTADQLRARGVAEKLIPAILAQYGPAKTPDPVKEPKSRYRSKLEADYALRLEAMRRKGEIIKWCYEAVTYDCGCCRYTPDFELLYPNGHLIAVEVKGSWRGKGQQAAKIRLKAFIKEHGWRYSMVMVAERYDGMWIETNVKDKWSQND